MSEQHEAADEPEAAPAPTLRQEKAPLVAALRRLKDAARIDGVMAMSLCEINGLENALAFVARLDRFRRWEPPPFPDGAVPLSAAPPHPRTCESVQRWMRESLPATDRCNIWAEWQERKDDHPVVCLRGLPFVVYWAAYEAWHGPVPPDMDAELACGEYRCVNPKHVVLALSSRSRSDSES